MSMITPEEFFASAARLWSKALVEARNDMDLAPDQTAWHEPYEPQHQMAYRHLMRWADDGGPQP